MMGEKWFSREQKAKRFVTLVFSIVTILFAIDRFSSEYISLAAFGNKQTKEEKNKITRDDCSFLQRPESIKEAMAQHREKVSRTTELFTRLAESNSDASLVPPQDIPRKNFIDNLLFDRMARDNVLSAALCTDEEFIRRVYLDLTGRIPSAEDVTIFLNDANPNKRDALVDRLIGSPEFVDKWTMFYGDLFKNNARSVNVQRYTGGRDAFYTYIKN